MKKEIPGLFFMLAIVFSQSIFAQQKTENLVVVTLDGMRWQEVFGGVDTAIAGNARYTMDKRGMMEKFGGMDAMEKRKKLFPFLWTTVLQNGQLYGNRNVGSEVNNANRYKFSYPSYNEIFTGYPDTLVNSNDKIWNKNENVLEFINKQKGFEGKVAVFSTWDVFPYILNTQRSGLYVNAGVDSIKSKSPTLELVNEMQFLAPEPLDVRPDVITYFAGREYLKANHPRVLYISFDETDDYAHAGLYDQYLKSAHAEDAMLANLWTTLQSIPQYKNKSTLIITCDHGRGNKIKDEWRDHGEKIEDAGQIWIAAIGPDTKHIGEATNTQTLYQQQFAASFADILGLHFTANHKVAKPITAIYK